MTLYTTFVRSARNFEEFARAQKITVSTGLSLKQARRNCKDYNENRTSAQIRAGTKMELTRE